MTEDLTYGVSRPGHARLLVLNLHAAGYRGAVVLPLRGGVTTFEVRIPDVPVDEVDEADEVVRRLEPQAERVR